MLHYATLFYVKLCIITLHYVVLRYITPSDVTLRQTNVHCVIYCYVMLHYFPCPYETLCVISYLFLLCVTALGYVMHRYIILHCLVVLCVSLIYVTITSVGGLD